MLESQVNSAIVDHVFKKNELVSDRQLAYRKGLSTETMLIHLTEKWRNLIDSNMKIAVAFIDFKKAFDSVSHTILERKLECDFGLSGSLLSWVSSYLRGRRQYTAVNDSPSDMLPVTFGIPQGSVLGTTLFVLFTNDLLSSIDNGEIYMYADDTTVFAVRVSADEAIAKLNTALKELYKWCLCNKLTFHPKKSEFMLLGRGTLVGPVAPVFVGDSQLKQVCKTRLLGVTIDDKLCWTDHILELKKNFVSKLNLLKNSRFLPAKVLSTMYFRIILPSITHGLIVWGGCSNLENFNSLERLHCRAARIIYNLPRDMSSSDVLDRVKWPSIFRQYKVALFKFMHKGYHSNLPKISSHNVVKRECNYSSRALNKLDVPRFNTRYMKDSIKYRGAVLWNTMTAKHKDLAQSSSFGSLKKKLNNLVAFRDFAFSITSAPTSNFRRDGFIYY